MKLNNEDKRRLAEAIRIKSSDRCSEMSFDEIADQEMFSGAAARKIRGTFNKIWKIKTDWDIDTFDTVQYIEGNIFNCNTMLLFLLVNFRHTQMKGDDLKRYIYEMTGNWCYGVESILNGLSIMTDYSLVSYSNTFGIDCLTIK